MPQADLAYDVFISYNRRDAAQVEVLATRLAHEAGLRLWLDRMRLQPGFSWRAEVETALNDSAAALIVWGPTGLGPVQHQERDLAYAIRDASSDFRVIYVLLPETSPPQGSWANVDTWVRFESGLDDPDAFVQLVAALKGEAASPLLAEELPEHPAPYRGLSAFDVDDGRFFCGRKTTVEDILEQLSYHPFLAILGPSGSGKTSLVQAGLLAHLQSNALSGSAAWPGLVIRPGPHPVRTLVSSLMRLYPQADTLTTAETLAQRLQLQPKYLVDVVQLLSPPNGKCVLVVDRLEELFTLCQSEAERQTVLEALLALIDHPHKPAWAVVTMRADFYGHIGRYAHLASEMARHQIYVRPLTTAEVAEVIEAPAAQVGAIFEKGLAAQVRTDTQVSGEVALPLLEHTLDLLWRQRRGRWLTWDAYSQIGGVSGALRYHADRVMESLSPPEQDVARRLLMRLIWLEEGAGTIVGRRVEKVALVAHTHDAETDERVLQRLADERLVVLRGEAERATAELVHDTLPRHWEQLRQWVQEDQEFVLWHQRLQVALTEWERTQRDPSGLIRRTRLAEAERWLAKRASDLSAVARAFIQASQEQEQDEIERQRQEAKRYKMLFEEAEQQRRNALGRQLAAQAELTRHDQPALLPRSVLLAVEAMRYSHSLQADQTLRFGLALLPRPVACLEHESGVHTIAFSPKGQYLATASQDHIVRVWDTTSGHEIAHLEHSRVITATHVDASLAFSPDGQYLATANGDDTARVWSVHSGQEVTRMQHEDLVRAVAFSPDGHYLATASQDHTARVWHTASGREVARMEHQSGSMAIRFSPTGLHLATVSQERAVVIWKALQAEEVVRMRHEDLVQAIAFSPDGRYLASASKDHTARVWCTITGREIVSIPHEDLVQAIAFSPDGRYLASASQDHFARLWDMTTGRAIARIDHERAITSVVFSPDSRHVATAGGTIARMWEALSGREVVRMVHDDVVQGLAFSPDGAHLVSASSDRTVRVWEPSGYREVARMTHADTVNAIAFSPDGTTIATSSADSLFSHHSTIVLWEAETGRAIGRLHQAGRILALAFCPEGRFVASASGDRTARIWEVVSGEEMACLPHGDIVWAIAFSPDGRHLATAGLEGEAYLWETSSGQQVARMPHGRNVVAVAFSPDGILLATASADHTARVWEAISGREVARLHHGHLIRAVVFSPHGQYLATASLDGEARVWEAISGHEVARLPHGRGVVAVAFSPDGTYLATASSDHTARVWETANWREVTRLPHEHGVKHVVFSPDNHSLATASANDAWIWDIAGREITCLPHGDTVWAVTFSPSGRYLATISSDHTARVWLWLAEDLMVEACARLTRNLTPAEWQQYLRGEPYHQTCPHRL